MYTHTHTYTRTHNCNKVRRAVPGDSEPLRESVDFSDLLENSEEREEDRRRKYVQLHSYNVYTLSLIHI